jgi:hypothetical protein
MQRPDRGDLVEQGAVTEQRAGPAARDGDQQVGGHRDPQLQQRRQRAGVAEAERGRVVAVHQLGPPAEHPPDLAGGERLEPGQHLALDQTGLRISHTRILPRRR